MECHASLCAKFDEKVCRLIQYGGHVDLVAMECHVSLCAKFGFKVF